MRNTKKKNTTITVCGERWDVPRGFGAVYRRVALAELAILAKGKPGKVIDEIETILRLVGYTASREAIADWPLRKRVEAQVYCANVYARASDNPVQRHPKPSWLPDPWQGPWTGKGAFAGPTPTEIR